MSKKDNNQGSLGRFKTLEYLSISSQKQAEIQIGIFLEFIQSLPKSTQLELLPHLDTLKKQYPQNSRLNELTLVNPFLGFLPSQGSNTSRNVIMMAKMLFNLQIIGSKLIQIEQQQSKRKNSYIKPEMQNSFTPINVIHPKFEQYYRMSRQFNENGHGFNHEKPQQSQFYAPPRLFVRLEERMNFRSGSQLKGNAITGRNGLAVIDRNSIQWWEKPNEQFINNVIEQQKPSQQKQGRSIKQKLDNQTYKKLQLKYKIIGHHGKITSVSISYDELYLITAGTDNLVKLWCLRSKMQLTEYKCHMKTIWSVHFCPSGYYFLTGSADKLMKLWKTDEKTPIRVLVGHKSDVMKVQFLKNPDYGISASQDGTVRIWNLIKAQCQQVFHFQKSVYNFAVSFSGRFLSVCQTSGVITIFDLIKGTKLNSFSIPMSDLKRNKTQQSNGTEHNNDNNLNIIDICFSDNDRQFACISNKYILMYSMDTLSQKVAGNIFSIYGDDSKQESKNRLIPNQIIVFGRDVNLFYCKYHPKNYLVVVGSNKKY